MTDTASARLATLREEWNDADDWHIQLALMREAIRALPPLTALVAAAETTVAECEHAGMADPDALRAALAALNAALARP